MKTKFYVKPDRAMIEYAHAVHEWQGAMERAIRATAHAHKAQARAVEAWKKKKSLGGER